MITIDELRTIPLFAKLPDSESEALAARLADIHLRAGEWLVQEGEQPSFFMVVDGALDVRKIVHGNDRQINTYRPATISANCRCCSARRRSPACVRSNPRAWRSSIAVTLRTCTPPASNSLPS